MAEPPPPTDPDLFRRIIFARTPYKAMTLPDGWQNQIEWDEQRVVWNFRGTDHRVAKALRIPVIITYHNDATKNDETYLDWLLIGYEGGEGE